MAAFIRATISGEVLAGASKPHHASASKPGTALSLTAGVSGSRALRLTEVTASARKAPDLMCGENSAIEAVAVGTCPAIASFTSGPPPL